MKLIIAGSRNFTGITQNELEDIIYDFITASSWSIEEVVSGTARGIDTIGEIVAKQLCIPVKRFPAKWKNIEGKPPEEIRYNKYGAYWVKAGHERNNEMRDYADALLLIWDGVSRGSKDMKDKMIKAGKPVVVRIPGTNKQKGKQEIYNQ